MGRGWLGIIFCLLVAWIFSVRRREISARHIAAGIGLQFLVAVLLLKLPIIRDWVQLANTVVGAIEQATTAATQFLFGYLAGGELPYIETTPGKSFIVAFRVLPLVIVMSSLSALLFHLGILPAIVKGFAYILRRTLGLSGPAGMGAAADVFLGIAEAPLFVKPYLRTMHRSELFIVMSCGMASVAGTVMVLYASVIGPVVPDAIGHILAAALMTVPAALVISQIMEPLPAGHDLPTPQIEKLSASSLDAIARGAKDGVEMLFGIIALILVIFTFVNLTNSLLNLIPATQPITLQNLLGETLRPVVWLMGVPWSEAGVAGQLFGTKIILNEFVAYLQFAQLTDLSETSRRILTYTLCGFANLASLGILIGTLTTIVPERKADVLALSWRSLLAGNLASAMTGAIAGLLF